MRSLLPLRIRTLTRVLIEAGLLANASVRIEREGGNGSVSVIRNEEDFAGLVDRQMAWATAHLGLVEQLESATAGLDGVAAEKAVGSFRLACFRGDVQHAVAGIGGEKGSTHHLRHAPDRGQPASLGAKAIGIDAFRCVRSLGGDIDEIGALRR